MDRQTEQIDAVINILKLSDERQTRADERQDALLAEIRHDSAESTRHFDESTRRFDEQNERIETLLDTQLQTLKLMSRQADKTDELAERVPTIAGYESRVRRLEDAVFNKAS